MKPKLGPVRMVSFTGGQTPFFPRGLKSSHIIQNGSPGFSKEGFPLPGVETAGNTYASMSFGGLLIC